MHSRFLEKFKQKATLVIISVLCLPFFAWISLPQTFSLKDLSLYIALLTGFLGIVVLLAQFFLGTRSITGLVYRDLPWTLRLHKNLGIYGTLLIFAHPIFILLPYSQNLLYIITPSFDTPFEASVTWGRVALGALVLVWFTSAIVRSRIKYRPWKYIHYLSYVVLPLALIHSPPIGRSLAASHSLLLYWYGLTLIYLVLLALRLRHIFGYSKGQYTVVSVSKLTDDSWLLRLHSPNGIPIIHPGQYVYIQRTLKGEEHPYSVVDYDRDKGELLLAFKASGSFTDKLSRLQAGDSVLVDGPYGTFTSELHLDDELPRVFIAGGIGVTPFVRSILAASPETEQYLFFCNRTIRSSIFRRQLQLKIGGRHIDVLSQEAPGEHGQNVEHGYIDEQIISKYVQAPEEVDYFICGPKPMMDQSYRSLLALGVPQRQIHMEEFAF